MAPDMKWTVADPVRLSRADADRIRGEAHHVLNPLIGYLREAEVDPTCTVDLVHLRQRLQDALSALEAVLGVPSHSGELAELKRRISAGELDTAEFDMYCPEPGCQALTFWYAADAVEHKRLAHPEAAR